MVVRRKPWGGPKQSRRKKAGFPCRKNGERRGTFNSSGRRNGEFWVFVDQRVAYPNKKKRRKNTQEVGGVWL